VLTLMREMGDEEAGEQGDKEDEEEFDCWPLTLDY
jgi:hypothetical protein